MIRGDDTQGPDQEVQAWLSVIMRTHSWQLIKAKDRELLKARYGLGYRRGNTITHRSTNRPCVSQVDRRRS